MYHAYQSGQRRAGLGRGQGRQQRHRIAIRDSQGAECPPDTRPSGQDNHHDLVRKGGDFIVAEEKSVGGQLGRPSGARFPHLRTPEALRRAGQGTRCSSRRSWPRRSRKFTNSRCASQPPIRSTASSGPASRTKSWPSWSWPCVMMTASASSMTRSSRASRRSSARSGLAPADSRNVWRPVSLWTLPAPANCSSRAICAPCSSRNSVGIGTPLRCRSRWNSGVLTLSVLAQKRGMVAYQCPTPNGERLPDYAQRRKIEHQVAKFAHEHLIVFTDAQLGNADLAMGEARARQACREQIANLDKLSTPIKKMMKWVLSNFSVL